MSTFHFTFQYGSINTIRRTNQLRLLEPLHSNMVLLILYGIVWGWKDCFNFTFQYGSINTNSNANINDLTTTFTFQYGSINTCPIEYCNPETPNFTFQYGSINT